MTFKLQDLLSKKKKAFESQNSFQISDNFFHAKSYFCISQSKIYFFIN